LDRHVKFENEVLKINVSRLQGENEQVKEQKKKIAKQVKKWYARSHNVVIENRQLRLKIRYMKRKKQAKTPVVGIDIQINT
jgi:hypothetical protein